MRMVAKMIQIITVVMMGVAILIVVLDVFNHPSFSLYFMIQIITVVMMGIAMLIVVLDVFNHPSFSLYFLFCMYLVIDSNIICMYLCMQNVHTYQVLTSFRKSFNNDISFLVKSPIQI